MPRGIREFGFFPGPANSPEVQQYVDRLSTPPAADVLPIIQDLIDGLVADGIWGTSEFALLCPFLPEVEADALINLVGDDLFPGPPSAVGSPTWTEKLGYVMDGSNDYISMNWNPNIAQAGFSQNSACFGVYFPAHAGASSTTARSGCVDGTASHALDLIPRNSDSDPRGRANSASQTNSVASGANGVGVFAVNRSASNAQQIYWNGAQVGATAAVSGGVAAANLTICAFNNNGSIGNFEQAQLAALFIGQSRNATDQLAISDRLTTAYAARQLTA